MNVSCQPQAVPTSVSNVVPFDLENVHAVLFEVTLLYAYT